MKMSVHIEEWPLTWPFRISGFEWVNSRGIVVQVEEDGHVGRGEAQGVFYLDETAESLFAQVDAVAGEIRHGISLAELQDLLPAGGARNAVDCALWDLECKRSGRTIWQLTGIEPRPVTTVFTIGLEAEPEAMAAKAAAADSPVLKVKLDGNRPYEKLAAIRAARPDARLVVDANQGWDFALLQEVIPKCAALDLGMIEQPLPRGGDAELEGYESPVTLCADESALGCKLMVGNMVGTSLGMAPSFVIAQLCDFVDIDGPLLLKHDHPRGLQYDRGVVSGLDPAFWG
jgi:L-alanine-DL-glutamate epimerase-like enolase superfamily enzyme